MKTVGSNTQLERESITRSSRFHWVHWLILSFSLALTFSAWLFTSRQVEARAAELFEQQSRQVKALISDRMKKYEDALWAGVAAIQTHGGDVSYTDWHTFARSLRIGVKYPGINGIGVIHHVSEQGLSAYLKDQRQLRPDFHIHPPHDRGEFMPITFVEPVETNAKAVGLDMAHEANRYNAAKKARMTGLAHVTGPIVLVQDAQKTPGFLFYAPFYKGARSNTQQERIESFTGMVYAPFIFHKLIEGVLAKEKRHVRIRITDQDKVLYDEVSEKDAETDPSPMFTGLRQLSLYGRDWTFDIATTNSFRRAVSSDQPAIILTAGITIDALLLILFLSLTRSNRRAIAFADRVTRELKDKARGLEQSNAELEQFASVASHDLKAPLRAIESLAQMVQEDAGDKLPLDTQRHLDLMRGRATRMRKLLDGLLQIARTNRKDEEFTIIDSRKKVAEETVNILDVPAHVEVRISDRLPVLRTCRTSLQQIFHNLIDNAIKHHEPGRGVVEVSALEQDEYVEFAISDDGPGIPEEFRERIFQIFQTLKRRDEVEGSGVGLALVKKRVANLGGSIAVEAGPAGRGSVFRFTIKNHIVHEEMKNAA